MLNDLVNKIHQNAVDKGFWDKPRETGTLLALIHSEVSEALEADRNKDKEPYVELKLPLKAYNAMHKIISNESAITLTECIEKNAKVVDPQENFKEELADTVIRIFDLCGGMNIDIEEVIKQKMAINTGRPKMHGKRY